MINPDRTATITYQDKSLTFQMTGSTITLNDIPFEITCVWDEEYKLTDVNLCSVDQEIDCCIMLEPFIPE